VLDGLLDELGLGHGELRRGRAALLERLGREVARDGAEDEEQQGDEEEADVERAGVPMGSRS
jgi:hypothetical protein